MQKSKDFLLINIFQNVVCFMDRFEAHLHASKSTYHGYVSDIVSVIEWMHTDQFDRWMRPRLRCIFQLISIETKFLFKMITNLYSTEIFFPTWYLFDFNIPLYPNRFKLQTAPR